MNDYYSLDTLSKYRFLVYVIKYRSQSASNSFQSLLLDFGHHCFPCQVHRLITSALHPVLAKLRKDTQIEDKRSSFDSFDTARNFYVSTFRLDRKSTDFVKTFQWNYQVKLKIVSLLNDAWSLHLPATIIHNKLIKV